MQDRTAPPYSAGVRLTGNGNGLNPFFDWAIESGLSLSPAQRLQFEEFQFALYEANQVMNLTGVPIEECWRRHFVDSLLFHDSFPANSSVLDIGSGPGFPSWPLACARPDLRVTALDSNGKMLGFLRNQKLGNLEVVQERAEDWNVRNQFDCVTGRALAPLPVQLEISAGPCKIGGLILPLRTPGDDLDSCDLEELSLSFTQVEFRRLPGTDVERVLPTYEKVRSLDRRYPRRWAEIKAKPLVRF